MFTNASIPFGVSRTVRSKQRQHRAYNRFIAAIALLALCGSHSGIHAQDVSAGSAAAGDAKSVTDPARNELGEKHEKTHSLELADGKLVLQVPARWEKQPARSRIIEVELKVPPREAEQSPVEFRIVANENDPDHATVIAAAQKLTVDKAKVIINGKPVAKFVPYDAKEFGVIDEAGTQAGRSLVRRLGNGNEESEIAEVLVLLDELDVTGKYFESASVVLDQSDRPAISFRLTNEGAMRLLKLTSINLPNEQTGVRKLLGVILDGQLKSAPAIVSPIRGQGIIHGKFTEEEAQKIVRMLKAGNIEEKDSKQPEPGRLTIMRAGGSVEANIDRWIKQFKQPDGKNSREVAKVEQHEHDGLKVHVVDLSGNFLDRRGPFAPAQEKKNHRMLAAIIETGDAGNYFVKFTGSAKTVEQNATAFRQALEKLQWKP